MALKQAESAEVGLSESERGALIRLYLQLAAEPEYRLTLVGPAGERFELPEAVGREIRDLIRTLADGRPAALMPGELPLSPEQAAALLNEPTSFVRQLLEDGTIPSAPDGTDRVVFLADLMVYRRHRDAERRAALTELTRLHQELGLYDNG